MPAARILCLLLALALPAVAQERPAPESTSAIDEHREVTATEFMVASAHPLSDDQVAELRQALRTRVGRDVSVDLTVDPSLLGGLIVKIGSQMIDSSIKTRLNTLAHAMKG